jgi:hypothetical protein
LERPSHERVGVAVAHAVSDLTCCHSAIERPYFFSMDGKYDVGPCLGHGGDCQGAFEHNEAVAAQEIVDVLPDAEQGMSYGCRAFKVQGKSRSRRWRRRSP